MRIGTLVPVRYDLLAEYLIDKAAHDDVLSLSFESVRGYLDETVEAMLDDPDNRSDAVEDTMITDILLSEYEYGVIHDIVVTRKVGIVVQVDDHLLKLPLVLIKI